MFGVTRRGLLWPLWARQASGETSLRPLPLPWLSSSVPPHSVLPSLLFLSSVLCVILPGKLNHSMTFCLDLILAQICQVWGPQLLLALHFFFLMRQNGTRRSLPLSALCFSTLCRTAHTVSPNADRLIIIHRSGNVFRIFFYSQEMSTHVKKIIIIIIN